MDRLLWVMRSKVRFGYAAVNPELSLKWNWGGDGCVWEGGGGTESQKVGKEGESLVLSQPVFHSVPKYFQSISM